MGAKQGKIGDDKKTEPRSKLDFQSIKPDLKKGEMLKFVPLLARFDDEERAKMGGIMEEKNFSDKEIIIQQGDWGHGFYVIVKGSAIVTRYDEKDESKQSVPIGHLKEGDYFGEAALINESKRGATITADGDIQTLYLDREAFAILFSEERLNVQFAKRNAVSAEQFNESGKKSVLLMPSTVIGVDKEKDAPTKKFILDSIKSNLLFEGLSIDHKHQIVDLMWRLEVKEGTPVIEQGDKGDNFYVVESGSFEIFVKVGENRRKVASRAKGTCFGELALMYNAPRAASVVASSDSVVWVVDRFAFRRVLANVSDTQIGEYVKFLAKVELLAPLSSAERSKIAEALEEESSDKGAVIVSKGEQGDSMYIIQSGTVVCTIDGEEVNRFGSGDYFGERALMKDEPRAATVTAVTDVTLLKLDRTAFSLLLGPLEDIMQKRMAQFRGPSETKIELGKEEFPVTNYKREELVILGTLGKGSFGHVQLVKDPKSTKTYALKAVSKQQIVQTGQQGHVMSEKKVMASLDHPFLIKLYQTFKDKDRLYFLLELCLGGELFSVLRARTFFDEDTARFYAGSVVLAFEYMHNRSIIYRDLKPENLLLDNTGYLKVTDFGFAKVVTGRTYTLCGTPDYLAPEIVAGKGHGKGVDWWTLGILIYEMLSSYPPFYDDDPMKTYAKIMHGKITFPSHFSRDAVSLIQKLLNPKATKRLGVVKGGAQLIKEHPWFAGFDWQALIDKKLPAPIVPKIKNTEDLSNFDDYPDDTGHVTPYNDNGTNWEAEF